MSKYTSLVTSKKLYKAFPEWKKTGSYWFEQDNQPGLAKQGWLPRVTVDTESAMYDYPYFEGEICPAYDTDYLLKKLPKRNKHSVFSGTQLMTNHEGNWVARCDVTKVVKVDDYAWGIADTPAEALALLALKLKKEGML